MLIVKATDMVIDSAVDYNIISTYYKEKLSSNLMV